MAKEERKQLSYEELQQAANALVEENQQLKARLQQAVEKLKEYSDFSAFKRLDYLFKVVESSSAFTPEFVVTCVEEIEACMYPKEEEVKKEEK